MRYKVAAALCLIACRFVSGNIPSWHPRTPKRTHIGAIPKRVAAPDVSDVLISLSRTTTNFTVIQIGAHVGRTENDPVFKLATEHQWGGVLLEPVPELFSQLVRNYERAGKSKNLYFENAALSNRTGTATFYIHKAADFERAMDLSAWKTQVGSLRKKYGSKSVPISVKTISFNVLLDTYDIHKVDYLQIDAEGLDAFVIEQVPW
eukprot:CAMPEP_0118925214 /NCGR_PEP_ID=MMETSP1169-20130426/3140_1 /TAXON_ID=36882 /ORGANISM="Pyramimonas obovata, Strain CCMP722" /LENGTH=204 /DNA_ID=CAMNT_0006866451 /DNA_START=80 /DNA_END=691 /DNA_ORIENTATION=-